MAGEKVTYIIEGKNLLSKTLAQINKDADQTEQKINSIGKGGVGGGSGSSGGGGLMSSIVGGNLLSSGIQKATGALLDFGVESVKSFAKYEQFQTALTTMFHGNREEAKMLGSQLQQFAKETPYELTEIQDATKQMLAFGSSSGSVVGELRMLGDVASGIGAPIGDIAYLYGTIRTQGRAMTVDINQFANRGIPIWKELEKITGKNGVALRKFVEEGKVGFGEIEKVFKNLTGEGGQFSNLMEAQSKTLGGQLSNLSDAWDQLKVGIGESQSGILKSTVDWASGMINALNDVVQNTNKLDNSMKAVGQKGAGWFMAHFDTQYEKLRGVQYQQTDVEKNTLAQLEKGNMVEVKNTLKLLNSQIQANKAVIDYYAGIPEKHRGDELRKSGLDINGLLAEMSIKSQTVRTIMAAIESRNRKTGESKSGGLGAGADKGLNTGTTIEAGAPKNMYITINGGLVHEMNLHSVNGDIPKERMKEEVSKVLLEVLNDAHLAQR